MYSHYQPLKIIAICLSSCLLSPVIGRCNSIGLYCWSSHWSESIKMLFSHGLERCFAFVLARKKYQFIIANPKVSIGAGKWR